VDPQITVEVDLGGRPVRLTNIHLMSPVGLDRATEHREQAARLAALVRADIAAGHDVVLAGDFNATPGTAHSRAMTGAGLRESHRLSGWGRGTTWCRTTRLAYLPGIRLDHIFLSPGLACVGARAGGDTGSDHRPIVARITRRPDR
jgi:endonuclease/exonuclease/phosphatase (EEP) superfamily protein YafD